MIERRIEYCLLVFCTAFNFYLLKIGVPFLACFLCNGIEILSFLLCIQVLTSIGYAHKRYANLHFNDFILFSIKV